MPISTENRLTSKLPEVRSWEWGEYPHSYWQEVAERTLILEELVEKLFGDCRRDVPEDKFSVVVEGLRALNQALDVPVDFEPPDKYYPELAPAVWKPKQVFKVVYSSKAKGGKQPLVKWNSGKEAWSEPDIGIKDTLYQLQWRIRCVVGSNGPPLSQRSWEYNMLYNMLFIKHNLAGVMEQIARSASYVHENGPFIEVFERIRSGHGR